MTAQLETIRAETESDANTIPKAKVERVGKRLAPPRASSFTLPNVVEESQREDTKTDGDMHPSKESRTGGNLGALDKQANFERAVSSGSKLSQLSKLGEERQRREEMLQEKLEAFPPEGRSVKVRSSVLGRGPPSKDAPAVEVMRWNVLVLLADSRFDASIGIIILINSITIGWQTSWELDGLDTSFFDVLETIFLIVYCVELGMRFFTSGLECLNSGWVVFDAVLVALGVISTWILIPILYAASDGQIDSVEGLAPLMVLRVLRILRLARSLRLLVQFKTLWMLVRGLLSSAQAIFYTFVLMVLILYVFACMGVELITKADEMREGEGLADIIDDKFSSVPVIMLTLIQFVTLDSIGAIYVPLIHKSPYMMAPYFIIFILVVSVAMMNLVTAVIVEGAIQQAREDKEVQNAHEAKRIQALIPKLKEVFLELDEDGSGTLSLDEVENAGEEVQAELAKIANTDQLPVIFELLDTDGSGELSVDEFCQGLLQMITSDEPLEFIRMRKQLSASKVAVQSVLERQAKLENQLEDLQQSSQKSSESLAEALERIESKLEKRPMVTIKRRTSDIF